MRIIVCMKQVLDMASVRVSSRGELDVRDGVHVANPADLCALEWALSLADTHGAEVIALTLGDAGADDVVREALAMGAQRAVLLCDAAFAGSDAAAVSFALAQAVLKTGDCDLLLAGARSSDDGGGQVGPHMAELLGWPHVTDAYNLAIQDGRVSAVKRFEDGNRRMSAPLPAVVTVSERSITPRIAHAAAIMNACDATVTTWTAQDIGAGAERLGPHAALVAERRAFAPEITTKGDVLPGGAGEAAATLVARLRKRGLI